MALLKETPRSLRQYFGLVAGLQILALIGMISGGTASLLTFSFWETVVTAVLFIYIVVRFPALLLQPTTIKVVLALGLVESTAWFVARLFGGVTVTQVVTFVLAVSIYWYRWRSVVRLSAEAVGKDPTVS